VVPASLTDQRLQHLLATRRRGRQHLLSET
jgi:hypothetical protein